MIALLVAAGWGLHSYRDRLVRLNVPESPRSKSKHGYVTLRSIPNGISTPMDDRARSGRRHHPVRSRHAALSTRGERLRLSSLSCSGTALAATWEHTDFSEYTLLPFNGELDEQQPRLAVSHTPIRESLPKAERNIGSLLSREEAARRLYAFTQHFSLRTRLSWRKRAVKKVEKQDVACPWISSSWELSNLPAT
ncbi:MAG: hypothetical protein ACLR7Z_09310 [Bilophila wadsworthia]